MPASLAMPRFVIAPLCLATALVAFCSGGCSDPQQQAGSVDLQISKPAGTQEESAAKGKSAAAKKAVGRGDLDFPPR